MLALKDVKNYLNITWEDEDTDGRVKGAAARAQSSVRELIGAVWLKFVDFSAEESTESESSGTEAEQLSLTLAVISITTHTRISAGIFRRRLFPSV